MKTNLIKTMTLGALIMTTTGCFEKKAEDVVQAPPSSREALLKALETQADGLVKSFNAIIADGQFINGLALENPPEKLSMETEEDVKKAINYLLAGETIANGTSTYHPDKRICSEVIAKNNPAACEDVMGQITIAQVPQDATSGYVQLYLAGTNPLNFAYTADLISAQVSVGEIVKALLEIDKIEVTHNEPSQAQELPSVAQGNFSFTVAQQMGATIVDFTVNQAINVEGTNAEGQNYSVAIPAGQNLVTASLYPAMSLGAISLNIPQVNLMFPVRDENEMPHSVVIAFPGATGVATLNNAMSMIDLAAIKLSAASVQATIDGQPAVQLSVVGQLDAQVTSSAGDVNVKFLTGLQAQLDIAANNLFSGVGSITAQVTQNTELAFAKDADQAKVLSGSFSFIGTQDFTANMNAQAGMCIQGDENQGLYLETAICQ